MDLNSLIIIDKIADLGSFTAAAQALNIPTSNVSLKVKQLEDELKQPLFLRSTRKVVITEFGKEVRKRATSLAQIKEDITSLADQSQEKPSGLIRITAPFDVGFYLLQKVVPSFLKIHPDIHIDVQLDNRVLHLIEHGYDFAIRATGQSLKDSSAIAVKLRDTVIGCYAPYDSAFAHITHIEELHEKPVLCYQGRKFQMTHTLNHEQHTFESSARLRIHDMLAIKQAVVAGFGLGLLPIFVCESDVLHQRIVRILPEWQAGQGHIYAICPNKHTLTVKNRIFLDHLKAHFLEDFSTT